MTYHVTCNTDDNYAQHCAAMLCSLFENNSEATFIVHVLTHTLSADNVAQLQGIASRYHSEIVFHEVDESRLQGVKFRKNRPLTMAAYYRVLLPEIISDDIDKILYIDCDIIILRRILEIYDLNLEGYALAACSDASPYNALHREQLNLSLNQKAFCSGFMIINLKYWREHNATERLIEYSKRDRKWVFLHDQDSLNYVFRGQWFELPPKWNRGVMSFLTIDPNARYSDLYENAFTPKLIHYASNSAKPWYDVWFPEREHYIKYLKLSGYQGVKFTPRTFAQRKVVYKATVHYYLSKYVRPFVPDIVEMLIKDICNLVKVPINAIRGGKHWKNCMLSRLLSKHNYH